jgi:hypothetical protein
MTFSTDTRSSISSFQRRERIKGAFTTLLIVAASIIGAGYFVLNIYAINKGFSLWDEAYYLLSYQMAAQGFFRHFVNTPFLVAFLFEAFDPGLIGYRAIHFAMSVLSAGFLAFSLSKYLVWGGRALDWSGRATLYALAFVGAMYTYQISVPTLSYNHLNEFLVVVAEGFLLLAMTKAGGVRGVLLFVSGFILSLDIYVKPTSFISISLASTVFIIFMLSGKGATRNALFNFVAGGAASFCLSVLLFYPPSQWSNYLALMSTQQTHSPYKVLSSFLSSAYDMLYAGAGVILSGLVVTFWLTVISKVRLDTPRRLVIDRTVTASLIALHAYFAMRFLFPADIWSSFTVHWWYWWVYSSTVALIVLIINLSLGLGLVARDGPRKNRYMLMLLLLLAANPIGMSVGTLNGFGQVQIHLTSWLLLHGLVIIICSGALARTALRYSSALTLVCMAVGIVYIYRQQLPLNFSGQGGLNEQVHTLSRLPKLANVSVDSATYDLMMQAQDILDRYPDVPTISFFDLPGMQYAFGRKWVVPDPWLTNYEMPLTKDDVYNCQTIAGQPDKMRGTIFIVSHEKKISQHLRACLAKVGFPKDMKLIGSVSTKIGFMDEPIKFYLNP